MGLAIPPRIRFLKKHEKFSQQVKSDLSTTELINKLTGSAPKDSVADKLSDSGNESTSYSESEDSEDSDKNRSGSDESEDSEDSDTNESESDESEDSESETEESPGKPQLGSDRVVLERKVNSNATSKGGIIDPGSSSGESEYNEISEQDESEDNQEDSENDRSKKKSDKFNFDICDEDLDDILTIKKQNTEELEEYKNDAEGNMKEVSSFYSTSAIYILRKKSNLF